MNTILTKAARTATAAVLALAVSACATAGGADSDQAMIRVQNDSHTPYTMISIQPVGGNPYGLGAVEEETAKIFDFLVPEGVNQFRLMATPMGDDGDDVLVSPVFTVDGDDMITWFVLENRIEGED